MGARTFLDLGPGKALTRMLRDLHPEMAAARWVNSTASTACETGYKNNWPEHCAGPGRYIPSHHGKL